MLESSTPLGRILRLPLNAIPSGAIVRIPWGPLRGARWIRGSGIHRAWMGFYESDKSRLFKRTVRSGDTVFDIGAHVGYYTVLAARSVGPVGTVIAFEPLLDNIRYLRAHIRLNRLTNVKVIEAAVAADAGERRFRRDEGYTAQMDPEGDLRVRTVGLDRLWRARDVPPPDLIKIDVEGAEHEVLMGAREMLLAKRPTVFLATHGDDAHKLSCSLLRELGYNLDPIDNARLENASEVVARASRC